MRILLLRHGEPDYSIDSLTPKGWREAGLLALRLASYRIRDFYVSPLGRAKDTAACTLRPLGREAETLDWLAEFRGWYPDPNAGHNRIPWDFLPRFWTAMPELSDPHAWADAPLFAGGTVRQIWDETTRGVDGLMARYGFRKDGPVWRCDRNTHDTIALFCHFGISMAVLAYLQDESPIPLWQHCLCVPSSLTEVVTEERIPGEVAFKVTRLGDTAHLECNGERRSTAGLFPECYTGINSTDPKINGEPLWDAWNPAAEQPGSGSDGRQERP